MPINLSGQWSVVSIVSGNGSAQLPLPQHSSLSARNGDGGSPLVVSIILSDSRSGADVVVNSSASCARLCLIFLCCH